MVTVADRVGIDHQPTVSLQQHTGDDMMTAGHFALFIIINLSFIYKASQFLNADITE